MTGKKDTKKAFLAREVASKHGVSIRYVYYVINGERDNDDILDDFMELYESTGSLLDLYQQGRLVEAVRELLPFN